MNGYYIRQAQAEDLDAIAGFEVEIARVSFGDEAVTDTGLHRKRVANALGAPGEITLVAVAVPARAVPTGAVPTGAVPTGTGDAAGSGPPVGWAWLSGRTNSLTGARYGNFRSLAVADVPGRSQIGELLLAAVLQGAREAGMRQLTGKVHARNVGMRTLYRKFGFEATHLTMEKRDLGESGDR